MARKPSARNRVMSDRLWDDHGQEWHKQIGWLSHEDIGRFVTTARVAVHEYGLPVVWLATSEAQRWWGRAQGHTQDGQRAAAESGDQGGYTYCAAKWTSGSDAILVFEAFC